MSGRETIYRWEHGDLKIKLKDNNANEEIKLGIYYQPLVKALDRTLVEEGPSDVFGPSSAGDKGAPSAPLFK